MTNSTKRPPFLMQQKTKLVDELMKKPFVFLLLTQIARRAKRTDDFNLHNLEIGESLIGDYKNIGATEQQYRTAKRNLQKWGFATFRSTNKGTIAKLTDTRVYNINENENNEQDNEPTTSQITSKQRTSNEPTTTNKKERNKEDKEKKDKEVFELPDFIQVKTWNDYLEMRIKAKAPNTERAIKLIIKDLTNFENKKSGNANLSLENSIKSNWKGVFEPKSSTNYQSQSPLEWLNK